MLLTSLFLGQFSSVIPFFGVVRRAEQDGHNVTPLGLKNGRFLSVLGLRSIVFSSVDKWT